MATQSQPVQGEGIRLEYLGKNVGAIPFTLPSGGIVRGANNPVHRFVWVSTQEDANHLVKTERFVLAPESTETPARSKAEEALIQATEAPVTETVEESEPKRRSNRKSEE